MTPVQAGGNGTAPGPSPRHTTVALEGAGADIALARRLTADFLTRPHHLPAPPQRVVDLARLVVSELVTNACKYAPGPLVMDLHITEGMLRIEVWDSEPVLPAARVPDTGRVGGHGLEIVAAIAHRVEVRREAVGKRVIAHLALTEDPHDTTG